MGAVYSSDLQYDAYGFRKEGLYEASPDETLDSYAKRLDQQVLQNDVSAFKLSLERIGPKSSRDSTQYNN